MSDEFKVPEGHSVKGVSALVNSDGEVQAKWIKTGLDRADQTIKEIQASFENFRPRARLTSNPDKTKSDLLTVYPIADSHIGALAWGAETGSGDYDTATATQRLRDTAQRLISSSPPASKAIILNLGDYFHMDDRLNQTPSSGNRLDVDGRYQKVVWAGVEAMRDVVDMALQKHHKIILRNLPGNHDPHSSFALTCAMKMYYEHEPRVVVESDPGEFFFYRFGVTLIGAHHGHRAKT